MKIEFQSVVWTSLVFVLVLLSIFPVALLQVKAESDKRRIQKAINQRQS